METNKIELAPGDVVRMKSGGPAGTVMRSICGTDEVLVIWPHAEALKDDQSDAHMLCVTQTPRTMLMRCDKP